jgi:hypothetical protein
MRQASLDTRDKLKNIISVCQKGQTSCKNTCAGKVTRWKNCSNYDASLGSSTLSTLKPLASECDGLSKQLDALSQQMVDAANGAVDGSVCSGQAGDPTAAPDKTKQADNNRDSTTSPSKSLNPFNMPSQQNGMQPTNNATNPPAPITPPSSGPSLTGNSGPTLVNKGQNGNSQAADQMATSEVGRGVRGALGDSAGGAGPDIGAAGDKRTQQIGLFPPLDGAKNAGRSAGGMAPGASGGGGLGASANPAAQASGGNNARMMQASHGVSTDVLKGERGGGGSGFTFSNAQDPKRRLASDGGMINAGFGLDGKNLDSHGRIDLKDYLPGHIRDPRRMLGGSESAHPDIHGRYEDLFSIISTRYQACCNAGKLFDCR